MAHVWNIQDGDIYVSKNGNDVTGDGSMAAPYASLNKGFLELGEGQKIVIGSGIWQETISVYPKSLAIIGDGNVIFSGLTPNRFSLIINYAADIVNFLIENIIFKDYIFREGLIFWQFHPSSIIIVKKCHTEYSGIVNYNTYNISYDLVIKYYNCFFDKSTSEIRGIIFNSTILNHVGVIYASVLINCIVVNYVHPIIYFNAGIYSCYYKVTAPTSITGQGMIFLNPKFNNPEIGDYTLKSDSPCLFAGKNNSTIGAFGLGYSFDANSSEFTKKAGAIYSQTAAVDDVIRTQQTINGITHFLFQLAAGHASGNVESTWIDMQPIRYLLITRLFANIIYNTLGVATSRPDNLESAGEKAVYYDFELKYCNEESEKAAATFKKVIWNQAVTIDNSNRGNADSAFVPAEAKYISARFIKIKLYMTEA